MGPIRVGHRVFFAAFLQGVRESPRIFFMPATSVARWFDRLTGHLAGSTIRALMRTDPVRSRMRGFNAGGLEQAVWASVYATRWTDPKEAFRRADLAVRGFRLLRLDEAARMSREPEPELELAPNSVHLSYDEFVRWYPVALKLALRRPIGFQPPDEDACRAAYDRYQRSLADFY